MAQEKICSDLAKAIGVAVPEIRVSELDGQPNVPIVVSIAHGPVSIDLQMVPGMVNDPKDIAAVQAAVRKAGGLLALHAWVGTGDLKDDHLVAAQHPDGSWTVAAIDFASALAFPANGGTVVAPSGPPSLIRSTDKALVEAATGAIETCSDGILDGIVVGLPDVMLPPGEKARIGSGLRARRAGVRSAMKGAGWI